MRKISYGMIALSLLLCTVTSATAQISIGIGLPNVSIGINLPLFPELVRVPDYPVYYAPRLDANYFFYDGMYWVYQDDNWYASSWYNGPWSIVSPDVVPLFVLRIPVRYYRHPPVYFRGWARSAPPRWGHHWGPDWALRRSDWNHWKRGSAPAPAPLPVYQRGYSGGRYPRVDQQHMIHNQQYRYQPQNEAVRQHYKQQAEHRAPQERPHGPVMRGPRQPDVPHSATPQPPVQHRGPAVHDQREPHGPAQHERQAPGVREQEQKPHDRGESREPGRGQGQGQRNDEERGQGRSR